LKLTPSILNKRDDNRLGSKVILNKKVYNTIIASATRFCNPRIPEEDWLEIYGILIGRLDKKNVIVTEAYAITHTAKKGHILKVSYDDPDYVDASCIEEDAYTRDPPEFIVGWYHSHPGIKIMFSQDDIKNQLGYQTNNPAAIGIVFDSVRLTRQIDIGSRKGDPVKQLTNDPGFKIFRLKDPSRGIEASYEEVEFEFSDTKITPALIDEGKQFAGDVGRLLPKQNFAESSKASFDKQISKIQEIYTGTESYVKTLIKKGEIDRIKGVIDSQKTEIEKIISPMEEDVKKLEEIMNYVEYKERGQTINQIKEIIQNWHTSVKDIQNKFNLIKV
jgi:proteasome lid subunit RPN8/RPN11